MRYIMMSQTIELKSMHSTFHCSGLCMAAAVLCSGIAGFVLSFSISYADGPKGSNHYSGIWINGVAMLLAVQAATVISCGLILLVSLGIALPAQSGWAVLWLVGSAPIALAAWQHWQVVDVGTTAGVVSLEVAMQPAGTAGDEESAVAHWPWQGPSPTTKGHVQRQQGQHPAPNDAQHASAQLGARTRQEGNATTCVRKYCLGCVSCLGWSSLFWGAVLAVFLVIQAANLASDKSVYPPPGVLVEVPIRLAGGDQVTAKLHLFCTGPNSPGLSTFILEAGGGAPGISMAGLADALAAAGRRACWYDRLGYGWSDDAMKPTTSSRNTDALHALLTAAPAGLAPPPYIVVGHSAGGQLALQYASSYPAEVTGFALLDSYSDVAIYLYMMRGAGSDMQTRTVQAPNGTSVVLPDSASHYSHVAPVLDLMRAVTPLSWARWITSGGKSGKYGPVSVAMYGNNKEWHAQWVEVLGLARGTLGDNLTLSSGRTVWQGAGWPDYSPKPVLLLPAAQTLLLPAPCQADRDFSTTPGCVQLLQQPQSMCKEMHAEASSGYNKCMADLVYADLYLSYKATLSSNTTLSALQGNHGSIVDRAEATVQQLLSKFAGV